MNTTAFSAVRPSDKVLTITFTLADVVRFFKDHGSTISRDDIRKLVADKETQELLRDCGENIIEYAEEDFNSTLHTIAGEKDIFLPA